MTRKDSQVLIFNKERILIALTTSTRSAALLTGVNENDVKHCCNEKRTGPGHYYYRINHQPLILDYYYVRIISDIPSDFFTTLKRKWSCQMPPAPR